MNKEQAIKIRSCFANGVEVKELGTEEINVLADELNNSVEKQTPKQPLESQDVIDIDWLCPDCHYVVGINNHVDNYCKNCGQKLKVIVMSI